MIARLRGVVDGVGPDHLVVDVGGVGYLVHAPAATLARAGGVGAPIALFIDTHVREDAIALYGFDDPLDRVWFRTLLSVPGVGVKVALSVLSVLPAERLALAIAAQDRAALTRADGVGPKLAARLLAELKDKVDGIRLGAAAVAPRAAAAAGPRPATAERPVDPTAALREDAVSALVNLGYGRAEAFAAVAASLGRSEGAATLPAVITAALRELAS